MFSRGFERDPEAFRSSMRCYFDSIGRIDPFDALGLPEFLPRFARGQERAAIKFFESAVDSIFAERRHLIANDRSDIPRDLLALLLAAGDPKPSEAPNHGEIPANILTFFASG